jgi:hypothetical protein
MTAIALRPTRPVDLLRQLCLAGFCAIIVALAVALPRFGADKECRDGSFSAEFSKNFDVRRCDLIIRETGDEIARLPLD